MATESIIQWNAQGIANKKDELAEMISLHNANILAVQERKLWNYSKFSIPYFTALRKDGHYNRDHTAELHYTFTAVFHSN